MGKLFLLLTFVAAIFTSLASEKGEKTDSDLYDYELFKAVQWVREYAEASGEKHLCKWDAEIASGKKRWPHPLDVNEYVTKRGLLLVNDEFLITPWGRVQLSGKRINERGRGIVLNWRVFRQDLLRHCKTTFLGIVKRPDCCFGEEPRYYYLLKDRTTDFEKRASQGFVAYDTLFRKISKNGLKKLQGSDVLVETDRCDYSACYALHEIDGQRLPAPEPLDCKLLRKRQEVLAAWEALTKRYETEKAYKG